MNQILLKQINRNQKTCRNTKHKICVLQTTKLKKTFLLLT